MVRTPEGDLVLLRYCQCNTGILPAVTRMLPAMVAPIYIIVQQFLSICSKLMILDCLNRMLVQNSSPTETCRTQTSSAAEMHYQLAVRKHNEYSTASEDPKS